jgi:thiamine pyrophosphokinase
MTSKFIILANGELNNPDLLTKRLASRTGATVIAADGGYLHAENLGLEVNMLIGDLDSVSPEDRSAFETQGVTMMSFPEAKDETDLELALTYAFRSGAEDIVLIGTLGGRLDMSIANLLLLTHPQIAPIRVEVWSDHQTAWVIRPPGGELVGEDGDTVSLIPIAGDVFGVSTKNLVYALSDAKLVSGEARGVSNVMTAKAAYVEVERGTLLVVHTPGRA